MIAEISEFLGKFENDVRYDCHAIWLRVSRSAAAGELRVRAREALPVVATRLEARSPQENGLEQDVSIGLAILLSDLGQKLGIDVPRDLPFGDRAGWVAWAKSVVQ